jgi:protein TonB
MREMHRCPQNRTRRAYQPMTSLPESDLLEPTIDAASFYVHKDGLQYGPESEENLRAHCAGGWLLADDLVWREGDPEWQPAGVIFADAFVGAEPPAEVALEEDDFTVLTALRLAPDKPWPWGSIGIAIAVHAALLLAIVEWLQLYPVNFTSTASSVSQDPPLEVSMIPEAPPVPPPPPVIAPPPEPLPPTPPPPPVAELPPPPPAPPVMPVQAPPPPPVEPMTPQPVIPEPVATAPVPVAVPVPVHHKTKPAVPKIAPVAPQPPAENNQGEPEYLANPRPEYPYSARLRRQQGTVLLLVTLDEAGNPTSVTVEQSSGVGALDLAARKKVLADWRFKPGQGNQVHVPVEFHLDD